MFGSEIFDVALGLALVYLLLSLVASAVREGIEGMMKSRAVYLEWGIRELLGDPLGSGMAQWLYEHPLIHALFRGPYKPAKKRWLGGNLPTYIPARNFAMALIDLARHGPAPYAPPPATPGLSLAELRNSALRIPSPLVQRALISAIDSAQGDLARVEANLQAWFDGAMDRVSGWYKRRTQLYLFLIGLGTTLLLNVNTVAIATYLWRNDDARAALARRAEVIAADTAYRRLVRDTSDSAAARRIRYEALASLDSLDLPIGWDKVAPLDPNARGWDVFAYVVAQVLGLLLTAFAITLGAPFWFDMLNKIMVIRSTVKPREKSPEEASEDRQRPTRPAPPPPPPPSPPPAPPPGGAAVPVGTAAAAPSATAPEPPHEPREWATGVKDEGIL